MAIVRPVSARSSKSVASKVLSFKNLWITNSKWHRKVFDSLKLLVIVIPPIGVVMALCGMSLVAGRAAIETETNLQKNLASSQAVGNLVTVLAQERGKTCLYLT